MSQQPLNNYEYTDLDGDVIQVAHLEWLEDSSYWDADAQDWLPCSRYYIGELYGDSQSVWLNEDLEEVDPEADPDDDDEEVEP